MKQNETNRPHEAADADGTPREKAASLSPHTDAIVRLAPPTEAQCGELAALWEASVRATHGFLREEDFGPLRREVREALHAMPVHAVRSGGGFEAFMGVDGETIEMLFVRPDLFGCGLGKRLVHHAVGSLGAKYVDVNEQNTRAAAFYRSCGFRVAGRDDADSAGRPYPLLHLKRE